jgi:hypothetical protein
MITFLNLLGRLYGRLDGRILLQVLLGRRSRVVDALRSVLFSQRLHTLIRYGKRIFESIIDDARTIIVTIERF